MTREFKVLQGLQAIYLALILGVYGLGKISKCAFQLHNIIIYMYEVFFTLVAIYGNIPFMCNCAIYLG